MTHRTGFFLLLTGVSLALGVLVLSATAGSAQGQIELSTTRFDFGTVPNTAPVSHTFQVRNIGRGPLSITGVSTSCGCTTASISHQRIEPGQTADLTVTYDPLAHDGAVGEFMRVVYVRSDDPDTPEAALTFHVRVVER